MEKRNFQGSIKELGQAAVQTAGTMTMTTYSYIEMSDGQLLKSVMVAMGLDGKLKQALEENQTVELYTCNALKHSFLVGIKMQDGRLYSQAPSDDGLSLMNKLKWVGIIGGVLTIPIGIGFVLLFLGLSMRSKIKPIFEIRKYANSLSNAIVL